MFSVYPILRVCDGNGAPMFSIDLATPADAAELAPFAEQTFRDTFAADNTAANMDAYCAESFGVNRQRQELEGDVFVTLLARHDRVLAGYVQVCWDKHPDCLDPHLSPGEIRRIYVHRRFQGHGYGRKLLEAGAEALVT
ncbi:MAG: GNAT family N-acetyltransferase, partial [Pseudomonadota bacterium]